MVQRSDYEYNNKDVFINSTGWSDFSYVNFDQPSGVENAEIDRVVVSFSVDATDVESGVWNLIQAELVRDPAGDWDSYTFDLNETGTGFGWSAVSDDSETFYSTFDGMDPFTTWGLRFEVTDGEQFGYLRTWNLEVLYDYTEPDTQAPSRPGTMSVTASGLETVDGTDWLTDDSPKLSWGAASDNRDVDHYEYRVDGGTIRSTDDLEAYLSGLDDGERDVAVRAVDTSGNESYWRRGDIHIDTRGPEAVDQDAVSGDDRTTDRTPLLSWDVPSDHGGSGVASYDVEVSLPGVFNEIERSGITGTQVEIAQTLDYGTYEWRVRATDEVDHTGDWSDWRSFEVRENQDPTLPAGLNVSASSATTAGGRDWLNDRSPTFSWSAASDNRGIDYYQWRLDDGTIRTTESTEVTPTGLSDGDHEISVNAVDLSGNHSSWISGSVSIDAAPPTRVNLDTIAAGNSTADRLPTFTWDPASDRGGSGVASYEIAISDGLGGWSDIEVSGLDGTAFTPDRPLPWGEVTWKVRATDATDKTGDWSDPQTLTLEPNLAKPGFELSDTSILDSRVAVGSDASSSPFSSIIGLQDKNGEVGTGFFVDENTLLTSAHLVYDKKHNDILIPKGKITANHIGADVPNLSDNSFYSGPYIFDGSSIASISVSDMYINEAKKDPDAYTNLANYDYAQIKLKDGWEKTTTFEPTSLATNFDADLLPDAVLQTAGRPGDSTVGKNEFVYAAGYLDDQSHKGKYSTLEYNGSLDTSGGQSGSPIWWTDKDGLPKVVGIHSISKYIAGYNITDFGGATFLSRGMKEEYLGWEGSGLGLSSLNIEKLTIESSGNKSPLLTAITTDNVEDSFNHDLVVSRGWSSVLSKAVKFENKTESMEISAEDLVLSDGIASFSVQIRDELSAFDNGSTKADIVGPHNRIDVPEIQIYGIENFIFGSGIDNEALEAKATNTLIRGGGGDDTLHGGPGNDRLEGEGGDDRYVFDAEIGIDRIADPDGGTLAFETYDRDETNFNKLGTELWLGLGGGDTVKIEDFFAQDLALGELSTGDLQPWQVTYQGGSQDSSGDILQALKSDPNAAPDATTLALDAIAGEERTYELLQAASDPDGDPLRITGVTDPAHGSTRIVDAEDGRVAFTPDSGFTGTATFSYTVADPDGASDTAQVSVDVAAAATEVVARDDSAETARGAPVRVAVLANDSPTNVALDVTSAPAHGSARVDGGEIVYSPETGFIGTDSLAYTAEHADGGRDTATVEIAVGGAVFRGHDGDDVRQGTPAADHLAGRGGADRLESGGGADILDGGSGDDTLVGGAGADTLRGGPGTDTASYAGSSAGIYAALAFDVARGGHAEGDSLSGIEDLVGSAHADTLGGTRGVNRLEGRDGHDRLVGGGSDDTLLGGAGADQLRGGSGADALDGGAGRDSADYSNSGQSVYVALAFDMASGGTARGDRLMSIENLIGSAQADTLGGTGGVNTLEGRSGDDRLVGGGSDDTLLGGAGSDELNGGSGADRLDGGPGDDLADYGSSGTGVYIALAFDVASGGIADGDTLTSVEAVRGSAHADTLGGDSGGNRLEGLAGADTLVAGGGDDVLVGGAGADTLRASSGSDTVSYKGSDAGVYVALAFDIARGGHAEGDRLSDAENLLGSRHGDTLGGDSGANRLAGGEGDDVLVGGGSADTFVFSAGDDTVRDYTDGRDTIDLSALDTDFTTVQTNTAQSGSDAVFTDPDGAGTLTLENTDTANLNAGDFTF